MVKIDLITGFLGSGKTTFIKKYARYLLDQGLNIGILENDFGAVNVDMMLLKDLEGDHCELEMVSGGCDADCHRRRFKTKLIAMGMCGYDRVIVEPSGIFDMDEFFDILREEPLDQWYEIGSVIAVVDAGLDCGQSEAADYLLASEAAGAGCIVLSKVKNVSAEQTEAVKAHLEQAMKKVGCRRSLFGHIIASDWEQFTEEDYQRLFQIQLTKCIQSIGSLLKSQTCTIDKTDNRCTHLHCHVIDSGNFLGMHLTHGTSEYGSILAIYIHKAVIDNTISGNNSV